MINKRYYLLFIHGRKGCLILSPGRWGCTEIWRGPTSQPTEGRKIIFRRKIKVIIVGTQQVAIKFNGKILRLLLFPVRATINYMCSVHTLHCSPVIHQTTTRIMSYRGRFPLPHWLIALTTTNTAIRPAPSTKSIIIVNIIPSPAGHKKRPGDWSIDQLVGGCNEYFLRARIFLLDMPIILEMPAAAMDLLGSVYGRFVLKIDCTTIIIVHSDTHRMCYASCKKFYASIHTKETFDDVVRADIPLSSSS